MKNKELSNALGKFVRELSYEDRFARSVLAAVDDYFSLYQNDEPHELQVQLLAEQVAKLAAEAAGPHPTREQLQALKSEAFKAGDYAQEDLCRRALYGDYDARVACQKVIDAAQAMGD
jgi:hypothetical protein